jgi:hypothetical protein
MNFLCIECDQVMEFAERQLPGDGTMAAVFTCGKCDREVAMLTNPMETQLVSSLGIKVGGRTVPGQPMELVRNTLASGGDVFTDGGQHGLEGADAHATVQHGGRVTWSADAQDRLARVPAFVRGMVKKIYTDYAREHGLPLITPDVMDRARTDLGLEGM